MNVVCSGVEAQLLLNKTITRINNPDFTLADKAQCHLDNLTKPQGSLGKLEDLAKQIVTITGNQNKLFTHKIIFILAGDHGIAEEGVSAFPQEVTVQMIKNFLNGGAGINVLARHVNARVVVADLGVKGEIGNQTGPLKRKKINKGTDNFLENLAMSSDNAKKALAAGIEIFNEEKQKGIDIIGVGEMGIANTTSASAIVAAITQHDVAQVTGRGTGISENVWEHKVEVIKKSLHRHNPQSHDAIDILSKVGGYEIAGMAGLMLAAAADRTPIILDGFISTAAALIAFLLEPKIKHYFISAHNSVEQGHKVALNFLNLDPLLDLNLRLGEGSGAALAMHLVEAASKIFNEMSTFEQASVSSRHKE